MSLEKNHGETDKNVDSQGKDNRRIDYTKHLAKQKEADMKASTSKDRTAEEQQGEINESHQRHQNDTDRASQLRAIFGMNFVQNMKGVPAEITGAYDPKQERWIMQKQEQEQEELLPRTKRITTRTTWNTTQAGRATDRVADNQGDSDPD